MLPSSNALRRNARRLVLGLFFASALSGCGLFSKDTPAFPFTPPPTVPSDAARSPEEFVLRGVADSQVNLDVTDRPLSVVVRVYQLRTANEFSRLNFDALASGRGDTALFPKDFVSVNEIVLVPGTTQEFIDKLMPETKFLGVVGFFRRPEPRYWRFMVEARGVRNEGLTFRAKNCFLESIAPRADLLPDQPVGGKPDCYGLIGTPPKGTTTPNNRRR